MTYPKFRITKFLKTELDKFLKVRYAFAFHSCLDQITYEVQILECVTFLFFQSKMFKQMIEVVLLQIWIMMFEDGTNQDKSIDPIHIFYYNRRLILLSVIRLRNLLTKKCFSISKILDQFKSSVFENIKTIFVPNKHFYVSKEQNIRVSYRVIKKKVRLKDWHSFFSSTRCFHNIRQKMLESQTGFFDWWCHKFLCGHFANKKQRKNKQI